jgi:hypothetical protein
MSDVWAAIIVIAVTCLAITAMLLVRRGAPAEGYFEDGDRAAGVFGVIATGFAVLAGFVVFLAFESYDTSRSGAEAPLSNRSQTGGRRGTNSGPRVSGHQAIPSARIAQKRHEIDCISVPCA